MEWTTAVELRVGNELNLFQKKIHRIARAQLWGEPGKEVCVHSCTKFDLIWKADCCRCREGSRDKVTLALRHILYVLLLKTTSSDEKRETSETHRHRHKGHTEIATKTAVRHSQATDCKHL